MNRIAPLCLALALMTGTAYAQHEQEAREAQAKDAPPKPAESVPRFTRALTNVQIEVTLTDQHGAGAPDKKTVSMIVTSGQWGKIRSSAPRPGNPSPVNLGVDARPFVTTDGPIQLELTLNYYPPQGKPDAPVTPTELNQSLTVLLQSGKPLLISQAADPTSDRKITVDVKATILK